MKSFITIAVVLTSTATVIATPNANAKEICGDLGVVDLQTLPQDLDPAKVRLCAEHPLGRNRVPNEADGVSLAPRSDAHTLQERACVSPGSYGCSDGYCWTSCKSNINDHFEKGEWCWLAHYYGTGVWAYCNTWADCTRDPTTTCGKGDNCPSCGCSC